LRLPTWQQRIARQTVTITDGNTAVASSIVDGGKSDTYKKIDGQWLSVRTS
jgi:hypothetical protein